MDYKKEDMIDLSEESIKNLFNYCVATKETSPENTIPANFIHSTSDQKVPDMKFNEERVLEKENTINYLLGQLKAVHINNMYMQIGDGFYKYDDTIWTKNKMILFTLYYLGNAVNRLPQFKPSSRGLIAFLERYSSLKPTLSPNDPNFKKKPDGQEPADD